ncbi:IclR family transcriptional regulator [Cryptosporangium aurantiacum]|uniref:Transcriptional regulator, IclR family n=1 Tax=Cryptosporangium aurantiacum TaxID=134849 RepID=A0A1M7RLF1_9ACTN|nr:IclR family transcriptional regulator [Cryptosporangium aurantiacum]SHN46992.1 transcriptional regulator, IclR family [Cryptosporangium aurantiacum]
MSAAERAVTTRALRLLGAFDTDHPRLRLSAMARRSGLPLSTAHRLVAELEQWGAVDREPDGAYVVGRRIWQLALLAPIHGELREIAMPFLEDVHRATGENVHLAIRDGTHSLYIERIWSSASVPLESRVGRRLPLHATAAGKALLAAAPAAVVDAVLGAPERLTPRTLTDPAAIRRDLADVRARGYAFSSGEATPGTWSVAVGVPGPVRTTLASLAVVAGGPGEPTSDQVTASAATVRQLAAVLMVAAAALGRELQRTHR